MATAEYRRGHGTLIFRFDKALATCWALILLGIWSAAAPVAAITVDIRPLCEVTGGCTASDFLVSHPEALGTLQFAAQAYEAFADQLTALPSSPGWTATLTNPNTGAAGFSLANLAIPANTLVILAGGRDLAGNFVGEAGPGMANISLSRGQGGITGSTATDFATWGGSIAFDTLNNGVPRNWHFGIDSLPAPGQLDFLTIAFHELAHVFGFGTSDSFSNLVSGNQFHGTKSILLTGAPVGMSPDQDHWATGTTSPPYTTEPLSALTPTLTLGKRRTLTPLDFAALDDLGWEIPERLLGLHGDVDQDGDVDGRDLLFWQRGFGLTGPGLLGDPSGDQVVDGFDLWLWQANFGQTSSSGNSGIHANVPEPRGVRLLGFALLWSALLPRALRAAVCDSGPTT